MLAPSALDLNVTVLVGALVTGTLIGGVGVGGVLLAPLLVWAGGFGLHEATAAASCSFLLTGLVGTSVYARHGSVDWRLARRLTVGLLPAALVGAYVNTRLDASLLGAVLALLTLVAGVSGLRKSSATSPPERTLSARASLLLGGGVGFGSALTGTGGPVLLLPVLTLLRLPVRGAVGVGQVVQIPLALFAALGFWLAGTLELRTGLILGAVQGVGAVFGASVAHRLPRAALQTAVGIVLLLTAGLLGVRSLGAW